MNAQPAVSRHDMVASLPALRWVSPDGLSALRRVHRGLARHEGISVGLMQQQVVWRCLGTPVARVWFARPPAVHGAAMLLELTVFLSHHERSPRWSDVVPLQPGRLAHHLPVQAHDDIDLQVLRWLKQAWDEAWHGARAGA